MECIRITVKERIGMLEHELVYLQSYVSNLQDVMDSLPYTSPIRLELIAENDFQKIKIAKLNHRIFNLRESYSNINVNLITYIHE